MKFTLNISKHKQILILLSALIIRLPVLLEVMPMDALRFNDNYIYVSGVEEKQHLSFKITF